MANKKGVDQIFFFSFGHSLQSITGVVQIHTKSCDLCPSGKYLRAISCNSHAHHSCVVKQEKLSGSCLSAIYEFGSIQFSDDGFFHNF